MAILSWLANLFLEFVWKKISAALQDLIARVKRHKQIDKEADQSVEPGKQAKSDKEIEDALKDTIGSGF